MATDPRRPSGTGAGGGVVIARSSVSGAGRFYDTGSYSQSSVIMVQGTYSRAGGEVTASLDPVAVKRKLAIRKLNEETEGRTVASDTQPRRK